ncbi:MAG: hypothetical protein CM15mP74_23910 [Halieaceae bacterium]|nr:MAG: hypothetical protein CM15mP74_23910 [Halieaceae bacterium]
MYMSPSRSDRHDDQNLQLGRVMYEAYWATLFLAKW